MDYGAVTWSVPKCGLLLKSMAQTLNMGDKDVEMTNALKLFGKEMVDLLYPDPDCDIDPIVNNPGGWNFGAENLATDSREIAKGLVGINAAPKSNPDLGSNNWAVSGSRTATGAPILCNDP